jgi:hypothetical protein
MKVIGFSAKKQGGKSTAVYDLKERLEAQGKTVAVVAFADCLKDAVGHLFAAPAGIYCTPDFNDEGFKNTVHPCGKTYRQILQIFGTDFCRNLWPDIWVENWKWLVQNVYQNYDYIFVPDVRFGNEVRAIQDLGGHVVRLTRAPFASQDQHGSETALDDCPLKKGGTMVGFKIFDAIKILREDFSRDFGFDAIIDNSQMSIAEQNETVWKLVSERNWM